MWYLYHDGVVWKTFNWNKKVQSGHWPDDLRVNGYLHLCLLCTSVDEWWVLQARKNKHCVPQRYSFHFEQDQFWSIHTLLSYQHATNWGRTDSFSALYSRYCMYIYTYMYAYMHVNITKCTYINTFHYHFSVFQFDFSILLVLIPTLPYSSLTHLFFLLTYIHICI